MLSFIERSIFIAPAGRLGHYAKYILPFLLTGLPFVYRCFLCRHLQRPAGKYLSNYLNGF